MSMLAEPKRKQKFSLDPRGSKWSNDENKFGQKMLERMGWKKGRGLGLNEDGQTEHVKITHKMDNKGVGCSNNHADNWIAHQDDFNALLANLNQDHSQGTDTTEENKVVSLEKKSKASKSRVHYQKFTKGKDLSGRSLGDLDCIFGKRKSSSAPSTPQGGSEANSEDEQQDNYGLNVIKSEDNVQEYFAKKMALMKKSRNTSTCNLIISEDYKSNNNDEEVQDSKKVKKVRFQIADSSSDEGIESFTSDLVDETPDRMDEVKAEVEVKSDLEGERKHKKKKKKSNKCSEESSINEEHHKPNACRKKRKKKKEYEKKEKGENEGMACDSIETERRKSKKKKKKKLDEETNLDNSDDLKSTPSELPKRKKSKTKKKNIEIDESVDLVTEEANGNTIGPESENVRDIPKRLLDEDTGTSSKRQKTETSNVNVSEAELEVKNVCKAFVGSNLEHINGYALATSSMDNILKKYKQKHQ
ncbi:hypothetical protein ScPMuIL_015135 [Solemya velum]